MSSLRIVEPSRGCVSLINKDGLLLEIEECNIPFVNYAYEVHIDDLPVTVQWCDSPWKNRKFAKLSTNLETGSHTVKIVKKSKFGTERAKTSFWAQKNLSFVREVGISLMGYVKRMNPPHELNWGWGEGLFLEGCVRFEKAISSDPEYIGKYARNYHSHWARIECPTINKSDLCSPGLSALSLLEMGDESGYQSLKKIVSYLQTAPRNSVGALNHLGNSYSNWFYPRSIWVDSLMMYAVLAVKMGAHTENDELLNFGLDQFEIFAEKLQDPTNGLWRHAWLERFNHTVPETETYWLRGNGWALASTADVLDYVPDSPRRTKLIQTFMKTLDSILLLQQDNGLWDSITNIPGYTYPETSGSLLIGYSITRGVRRGWLDKKYLPVAEKVANSISCRITYDTKNYPFPVTLHGTSGPTNPFPRWVYGLIQEEKNSLYGIGAYFMLSAELLELERNG